MILLTGFYIDSEPRRQNEFLACLQRNLANEQVAEIHLFVEDASEIDKLLLSYPLLADAKFRLLAHHRRVTYQDLFAYANRYLTGQCVIIANADIYFDDSLALLAGYDLAGKLLCLSRWDVQVDGSSTFFEHPNSQDAWIFQTPIAAFPCDFHLGVLGCDNRLAWQAERAGLALVNPGRSLRANHLHLSQVRRYNERQRLVGPTRSVPAIFLPTPWQSMEEKADEVACATIAFYETMGYSLARLENGISSHNNEARPISQIPPALAGLQFTQVVAYAVSPIEIAFLTSGKLYVLVGNDWAGSRAAIDWLKQNGLRQALPLLETQCGTGFEAWSLVAEAGDRFTLPTQVMLVAAQLVSDQAALSGANRWRKGNRASSDETVFALTSLAPGQEGLPLRRACIQSWQQAGLQVCSFNHPSEIGQLAQSYDVDFVPVMATTAPIFGNHFIPIKTMLEWAVEQDAPVLLINSDIQLAMTAGEMKRIRRLADGGLCYFVRYNHNGHRSRAMPEPFGIDTFLLHGRAVTQLPDSFLSMGQPFWDYWLPYLFATNHRPIYTVEFPATFHQSHPRRWSWASWHRCALEFARMTGELGSDQSLNACLAMSARIRQEFDRQKVSVRQQPFAIQAWVQEKFRSPEAKLFLELGAHRGTDTAWLAALPNVTIHAFEPDPRNRQVSRPNVTLHRAAIGERDGVGSLILSRQGWGQEWTHSSSLKQPKNHLQRFPVTFGESVEVRLVALDTFTQEQGLGVIDFIWADIQGAEGEMIRGGQQTLARTRYLYTEYSDDELYENQATLAEILALLPDFRVLELWPGDVLLENRTLAGHLSRPLR